MSLLESYKEIRIDAVVVILQSHKHNDIMCKPFHLKCLILPIRQKQDCLKIVIKMQNKSDILLPFCDMIFPYQMSEER